MSSRNNRRKKGRVPGIISFGAAFFIFSSLCRGIGHFGIFAFLLGIGLSVGVAKLIKTMAEGLDTTTHNREDTQHTHYTYEQTQQGQQTRQAQQTQQTQQAAPRTYYQYQQTQPVARPVPQEEPESLKKVKADTGNAEVDELLKQGREMIKEIRSENAMIPDSALTEKLNILENRCSQIFQAVREKPSKASQIRKFMNYYLPTTLKMVKAYRLLGSRGVSRGQMAEARDRIDSALGVVVDGTQKMLDNLYQEDMLDISTDIDVLEQMLKRDGLTESDLERAAQQAREAARIDMEAARIAKERAARQQEAAQKQQEAAKAAEQQAQAAAPAEPAAQQTQSYYYRTSTGVDQRVSNTVSSAQAHTPSTPTISGGTYSLGGAAAQAQAPMEKK